MHPGTLGQPRSLRNPSAHVRSQRTDPTNKHRPFIPLHPLQALQRLLNSWLETPGSDALIASFAVEKFAGQICLESMLLPGPARLDPADASSLGLLNESAAGLLMVSARAPQQLVAHLNR